MTYHHPGPYRFNVRYPDVSALPGQAAGRRQLSTPVNCIRLVSDERVRDPRPKAPKTLPPSPFFRPTESLFPWQTREILRSIPRRGTYFHWVGGAGKTTAALYLATITGPRIVYLTKNELFATVRGELARRFTFPNVQFLVPGVEAIDFTANVIVCGYHAVAKWKDQLAEYLDHPDGSTIIGDELQSIKEWRRDERVVDADGNSSWRPLWNWSGSAAWLSNHATRAIGLSGTPISNYRWEMWSQLDFLEPGAWGWSLDFMKRYCDAVKGKHGGWDSTGTSNSPEFGERLRTLRSRVTKEEVKQVLPPFHTELVYLSVREQSRSLPKGAKADIAAIAKRGAAHQNEARKVEASLRKRGWIADYLATRTNEDWKVMIVTNRRLDCDILAGTVKEALAKTDVKIWHAHGENELVYRDTCAEAYMAATGPAYFFGTYQSFGVGRNLQDTDEVLIVAMPDTIEQFEQLLWRFNRPGGIRPCVARVILAEGTSDDGDVDRVLGKFAGLGETISDDSDADMIRHTLSGEETAAATLAEILSDMTRLAATRKE